jgi:hypothetical protein
MIFTLEVLKASEGDCLLLHWGDPNDPKLGIIDGGPGRTYEDHLKPRLIKIAEERKLDQLPIEFSMVSHVDNDHIVGIDKLFRDLVSDVGKNPRPFDVKRLWHNTFDDIVGNKLDAHYTKVTASFTASAGGELTPGDLSSMTERLKEDGESDADAEHLAFDIAQVLAGHREGRNLRDRHKALLDSNAIRRLNRPFSKDGQDTLITAARTPDPLPFEGLSIHVVGPREEEIEALNRAFDKYLTEKGLAVADATLAAYADKSVPNLSSIVCMVSAGVGGVTRTMLLTGDARGDHLLECLRKARGPNGKPYLDGTDSEHLHVDIFKVPHHGSDRNAEPELFQKITADAYVLSANGKHTNPDRPVLEWIMDSRAKTDVYDIVLTYPVDALDTQRAREMKDKWDEQRDSLALLFEEREKAGYKFRLTTDAARPIELGDQRIAW